LLCVTEDAARAEWATFQGDAQHSGSVAGSFDPAVFTKAWQVSLNNVGGRIEGMAAGGGQLFVTVPFVGRATDPQLFAIDLKTGSVDWSHIFLSSNPTRSVAAVNPPAFSDGKVYVQSINNANDSYFCAFDARVGTSLFQTPIQAQRAGDNMEAFIR
jgi:outer membrane protein assembly factor BamB